MTIQEKVGKRSKSRTRVLMTATVVTRDGPRKALVRDFSANGAQVYEMQGIEQQTDVCFGLGAIFVAARVAWRGRGIAGLEFYRQLDPAELELRRRAVEECNP